MNEAEFAVLEITSSEYVYYTENAEWSTEAYSTYEEAYQEALDYGKFDVGGWDSESDDETFNY